MTQCALASSELELESTQLGHGQIQRCVCAAGTSPRPPLIGHRLLILNQHSAPFRQHSDETRATGGALVRCASSCSPRAGRGRAAGRDFSESGEGNHGRRECALRTRLAAGFTAGCRRGPRSVASQGSKPWSTGGVCGSVLTHVPGAGRGWREPGMWRPLPAGQQRLRRPRAGRIFRRGGERIESDRRSALARTCMFSTG